ncbi:MAG: glycosyltransferase family 39 protein [Planctomycetes bacterium]|nr:glycosyltransferase family 39 protein [Planctomycetota bacterium]
MPSARKLRFAALIVLFLLPLALRMLPLDHGGERIYVPDNHMVRAALGMARDHDLVPPVGKYSTYPNLMPYLLLPVYGAQFAVGRMTGAWNSTAEFGEHLLAHPEHAAWPARALIALLGALTVWVIFRAARAAGLERGAWVAAWLVGTGLLSVQMSTQERPWVPVVFFMAASAWGAILYVREPRLKFLVLSGICAGLSFSAHQGGLAALALPALALLFAPKSWNAGGIGRRAGHGSVVALAFVAVSLVLGHAYLLRYGWTPTSQAVGGAQIDAHGGFNIGGMSMIPELSWRSLTRLTRALLGYDPIVVCLGLLGIVFAWRERSLRAPLVFTAVWAAIFLTNQSDHVRYMLPVTTFLALPAGLLVERLWVSKQARIVFVALLCVPLVQAARFDWLLMRDDTRAIAERALAELPPGSCVAIDRYGPDVDLNRAGIYALSKLRNSRGQDLRAREAARKRDLDTDSFEKPGVHAIRLEEVFGYNDRGRVAEVFPELASLGRAPLDVFRSLAVTHYLRVDRRLANDDSEFLFPGELPGRVAWVINPGGEGAVPREAFLPLEMEFPLTALWIVERPGPWLELRALD